VCVAFSPDDRWALSCYQDQLDFWLWDVETGKPVRRFTRHTPIAPGHRGATHSIVDPENWTTR
jgi:hypothetical protein